MAPAALAKDGDVSPQLWSAYAKSIRDSVVATPHEVAHDLLVPTPGAPYTQWQTIDGEAYVLVGTARYAALTDVSPGSAFTLDGARWVTMPGELQRECREAKCHQMSARALGLRVKQFLGLPPDADYGTFTRFWVRPADLFRPCTDPRVTSPTCPAEVPKDAPDVIGAVSLPDFLWKQANYAWRLPNKVNTSNAISCAADRTGAKAGVCLGYPWTRLGYTFDWAPGAKDERGVTEFVVPNGTVVYLESSGSVRSYFPTRQEAARPVARN